LGGADRTADYDACVAETQFTQPGDFADPATEQRVKQLQTDLNNDFAACARANGFPEVEDQPPPVLDGGVTNTPGAINLPWRITEDELRDLLATCPVYDKSRLRDLADGQAGAGGTSWLEETILGPSIFFDIPSWDDPDGMSDEDFARFKSLSEVEAVVANAQLAEFIADLQAEGITYQGPRPTAGFNWVSASD
jgi:hypothetical protein